MSEHVIENNEAEREDLVPVAGFIVGGYLLLLTLGYFVGNAIYQIPG